MSLENFEKENQLFKNEMQKWLAEKKAGHFVVIKDAEVLGFYKNSSAAFSAGVKKYGIGEFFMARILPTDSTNISFLGLAI